MRLALIALCCALAPVGAAAQDVLKMIDGTQKQVKLIGVQDSKVLFYELGDPLQLEHDMPRNRVEKIIHEDGVVEDMRAALPRPGAVVVRQTPRPDTSREAVVLKDRQEIPAQILAVEPDGVRIRYRQGPQTGQMGMLPRAQVYLLRYADGSERNLAQEDGQSVRTTGRALFDLADATSADRFVRRYPVQQAAGSQGRLYTPDEVLNFRRYATLKQAIDNKAEVRFLDLHGQNLQAIPPDVYELKRLVGLDLSHNPLAAFPDQLLTQLPNLQYLWLDSCQLTALRPRFDNRTKSNLIYLSARGNRIAELHPALTELPSLYVLRLAGNRIERVKGATLLGNKPNPNTTLAVLDLSQNALAALPEGLGVFPQLRYLGCQGNKIGRAGVQALELPQLTALDLRGNPVTELDAAVLALPGLRMLHLAETRLAALPERGWAQAARLEELSLPPLAAVPTELWVAPSLRRLEVRGLPPVVEATIPLPSHVPDSLRYADVSGLGHSALLALALKARKPALRLRYHSTLMGLPQASAPGGPDELRLYPLARRGEADPALCLALALQKRNDFGLALAALAGNALADTSASARLRLEQARLLAQPEVQPYLAPALAVRDYASLADYHTSLPQCRSLRMFRSLCGASVGSAAQAPCREAAALLRRTAANLNALGQPAEAALLMQEAAALEAR